MRPAVRNKTHLRRLVANRRVMLRFKADEVVYHVRVTTSEIEAVRERAEAVGHALEYAQGGTVLDPIVTFAPVARRRRVRRS